MVAERFQGDERLRADLQEQHVDLVDGAAHFDGRRVDDFDGVRTGVDLLSKFDVDVGDDSIEWCAQNGALPVSDGGVERGAHGDQVSLAQVDVQLIHRIVLCERLFRLCERFLR